MVRNMRSNAGTIVLFILVSMFAVACSSEPENRPAPKTGIVSGPRLELHLEPGPFYAKDMRMLWIRYTVWPQVAAWIETPDGRYLDTIYVTELAVTGKYRAAPQKGRPEALPVWTARKSGKVDAVSSPTTVGKDVVYGNNIVSRIPAGPYVVMLETNRSYDWNGTYTKKNAGVNGQPSVVYRAEIDIGSGPREARFEPIGVGSVDGSDGEIRPSLAGIDTALWLFSSMTVRYIDK